MENGRSRDFLMIETIIRLYADSPKREILKIYAGS